MAPVSEWPLRWHPVVVESLSRYRLRWSSMVPYRTCPHGRDHVDDAIIPPDVNNAWMRVPEHCPRHACRRAIRRNKEKRTA